jgi:hypothetical protein
MVATLLRVGAGGRKGTSDWFWRDMKPLASRGLVERKDPPHPACKLNFGSATIYRLTALGKRAVAGYAKGVAPADELAQARADLAAMTARAEAAEERAARLERSESTALAMLSRSVEARAELERYRYDVERALRSALAIEEWDEAVGAVGYVKRLREGHGTQADAWLAWGRDALTRHDVKRTGVEARDWPNRSGEAVRDEIGFLVGEADGAWGFAYHEKTKRLEVEGRETNLKREKRCLALALEMLRSDRDLRREEANDYSRAICFETTCLGCARLLEQMHTLEDGPNGRNPWRDRAARWKAFAAKAWRENVAMARGLQGAYELNARTAGARYRAENAAGRWKALARAMRKGAATSWWLVGESLGAAARAEDDAHWAREEAERRGAHLVEARRELAAARRDYDRWAAEKNAGRRHLAARLTSALAGAARAEASANEARREAARAHAVLGAPPASLLSAEQSGASWHGLRAEVAELGRQFWWALGCCSFDPTDAESTAKYRAIADEARERLVALGYWVDGRRLSPEQVAAWRAGSGEQEGG